MDHLARQLPVRERVRVLVLDALHPPPSRRVQRQRAHAPETVTASNSSLVPKSSFWFNPATPYSSHETVPPVPPLPALYRPASTTSAHINDDPDPFKRQAPRMGS